MRIVPLLVSLSLAVLIGIAGCGGGGSSSKPIIGVTVSPSAAQNIDQSQSVKITATVSNDSASAGVSWSVTGNGSLSGQTSSAVTYDAPTSGSAGSATVTATSVADATKTASVTINYAVLPTITTTSLPSGVEGSSYASPAIAVTGGTAPLSFSATSGSLPTGLTLDAGTGAITGIPTGPSGPANFTVKVADSSEAGPQSATQPLSITIDLPPAPVITTAALPAVAQYAPYSQTVQATGFAPLSFAVASGNLPTGLQLNSTTGAITGSPQGPVETSNFTVTVTDASNPPQVSTPQSLSITVNAETCGKGSESLLNGQYALSLSGFDASGPTGLLGSFTANGSGGITAGTLDINSGGSSGVQSNLSITTGSSSYSIGADHRGCLTLAAPGVTRSFRFAVSLITSGVAAGARVIEFDNSGANTTGVIRVQTPSAFPSLAGNYAFGGDGGHGPASGGGKIAMGGVLTLGSGSITGISDTNDGGTMNGGSASYPANPVSLSGAYTIGANGRGSLSYTPSGGSIVNNVVYVLDQTEFFFMTIDAQSVNPLLSATALQQSPGTFGASSLNAASLIYVTGLTGTGTGSQVEAGIFTPNGAGTFSFAGDKNSGGSVSTDAFSGSYSVATSGRALISKTGSTKPNLIEYLTSANTGFVLSTDVQVSSNFAQTIVGGPFTNSSLKGTFAFATINAVENQNKLTEGVITFDGSGTSTGTGESNDSGYLTSGAGISLPYAVAASGRTTSPASGTTQTLIYIIFGQKLAILDYTAGNANPTMRVAEQ